MCRCEDLCLHPELECDGVKHCRRGEDEDPARSAHCSTADPSCSKLIVQVRAGLQPAGRALETLAGQDLQLIPPLRSFTSGIRNI